MTLTIFEKSQEGQHAYSLPKSSAAFETFLPPETLQRKTALPFPDISELDLTRHFNALARKSVGIDQCFFPLGSCTMKFNPRIHEVAAALPTFQQAHPLVPEERVQGHLQILWELMNILCEICGMEQGSLVPNAGAQGELTGVKMIGAYHAARGDVHRTQFLIPDSAHGTNPATAAMGGFETVVVRSSEEGDLDLPHLKTLLSSKTAGLMLTNPNTLGVFSAHILEIADLVHAAGGLLYYDGANLNPLLGIVRPGEMGFDVMHLNLHKTFATPHGGGGPGAGPVLCKGHLAPFLPLPQVEKRGNRFYIQWESETSIGRIASFYGNFSICLRAYLYAKLLGCFGRRRVAEQAILNANYLKKRLEPYLKIPFSGACMHEFVAQTVPYLPKGVRALDVAKRLLDFGVYAPTIYFPLTVKESLLIEPTETESKATLDRFVEIIAQVVEEIEKNPAIVRTAPHTTAVGRLDEVSAARSPILNGSHDFVAFGHRKL